MENREHYLGILIEKLYDYIAIIKENKTGEESIKKQNTLINRFYNQYKERFNIENVDEINKRLNDVEKRVREQKSSDNEQR